MEGLLAEVLSRIKPSREEEEEARRVVEILLERAREICRREGVGVPMLVGSMARGTWLRGEKDIDIFILLPEEMSREELEEVGLRIGRELSEGRGRERYAEHPYVNFQFMGFEVDVVPCYDIKDPRRIKSAVDRSPHHQEYVMRRLSPELREQVLLLKQFMKGAEIYGAELKVHGFSGYLCELLIIHAGSFPELLKKATSWRLGHVIDLEHHYPDEEEARRVFEGQPLIVVDPVDAGRNVAASVSTKAFSTFLCACRSFLRSPSERFFFPRAPALLSKGELGEILESRGTEVYCLVFQLPDLVPDVVYPQLRKSERAFRQALEQAGHRVVRSEVFGEGIGAIIIEVYPAKEKMELREGPPPDVDATNFVEAYLNSPMRLAGPFINEEGRVVYELRSRRASPQEVIERTARERHLHGKHIGEILQRGFQLHRSPEILQLLDDSRLAQFLSNYFKKCLPWFR